MWIESHPELENHPKFLKLCILLGKDKLTVIGLLHKFWWWCTAYAEDGDLRKYGIRGINAALQIDLNDFSLVRAGWIDRQPFLRVHDWWDYYGRFLKLKYRHNSSELIRIESLCAPAKKTRLRHVKDMSKTRKTQDTDVTDVTDVPNERTLRTYPNPIPEFASQVGPDPKPKPRAHAKECACEICFAKVVHHA